MAGALAWSIVMPRTRLRSRKKNDDESFGKVMKAAGLAK